MDAEEAPETQAKLARLGLSWVVAPVDPNDVAGQWSVYDSADPVTREPIKADSLASVLARLANDPRPTNATRGFVIPSTN
ncbi:hypothetical protein ACFW17_03955 [Streptomyces sp. NPDC058961]|uniref:hypothetical protein n=1 Tax=Streptomyces sp. NPDC058961 TaxID=3346680 RepID=UPI00367AB269